MEWWREVLIGGAVVVGTAVLGGVVRKKAYALGRAFSALLTSKLSTGVGTWFERNWVTPTLTEFMRGYQSDNGVVVHPDDSPQAETRSGLTGQDRRKRLWEKLGVRRKP